MLINAYGDKVKQRTNAVDQAYQIEKVLEHEPGPLNRQNLKHEKWTRIVRVGEEYAGTARIHSILADMISFTVATSESDEESQISGPDSTSPD